MAQASVNDRAQVRAAIPVIVIGGIIISLSMGIRPPQAAQDERHARALERIVQACRNTGKIPGLACSTPEEAKRRAEQGFQFLTAGSDAGFMLAGARAGLQTLGR